MKFRLGHVMLTPPSDTCGVYTVTVTVTDDEYGFSSATVRITVATADEAVQDASEYV